MTKEEIDNMNNDEVQEILVMLEESAKPPKDIIKGLM